MSRKRGWLANLGARLALPLRLSVLLVAGYAAGLILPAAWVVRMGIRPRLREGLSGILFHPLLHFNLEHLLANLVGLLMFGTLVALVSARHFVGVVAFAWIGGGALTWLIAAPGTLTGGASGVVYGLLGFLFCHGLLTRRVLALVFSLLMVWLFHTHLWGLLPVQEGVSWQGHLSGFIAGGAWAWLQRHRTL